MVKRNNMPSPKNALDFSKLPPKTIWNMNQKESTSVKTKPTITFDKSSAEFILNALGKTVDFLGHIKNSKGKIEKCGVCKRNLNIKNFAGIVKKYGLICDNTFCLIDIAREIQNE